MQPHPELFHFAEQDPHTADPWADLPHDVAQRIAEIVAENLASGRAQRVVGAWEQGSTGAGESAPQLPCSLLAAYRERVTAIYLQEHERVAALAQGEHAAWGVLFQQLAQRAYHMLLCTGVAAEQAQLEACDFAQQACETIFRQRFPYDVPFDAWATLILKNHIRWRDARSQDLTDRDPGVLSLDCLGRGGGEGDLSLHDLLADPSGASAFDCVEVQERLLQAIGQLRSRAQQQVIIDTFFYELDDGEIAERLGKSRNAVQILRHRALKGLREILGSDQ